MNRLVLSAAVSLALLVAGASLAPAAHADSTIDTWDKDAVAEAYHKRLLPAFDVAPQWTGDVGKCKNTQPERQPAAAVGTESSASKKATFQAINYYRAMAGLNPVKENPAGSKVAAQAALMMAANQELSHDPSEDWICYSVEGYVGANTSNLSISWSADGTETPAAEAIAMYMDDFGDHNAAVGHRRWILYPPASEFGSATTTMTNALRVVDEKQENSRPTRGTAWPSVGYFPWETTPTSNRWSYSMPGDPSFESAEDDHDFTQAKVRVAYKDTVLKTKIVSMEDDGVGDPTLVWEMPDLPAPKGEKVHTYFVTITGITATMLDEKLAEVTRTLPPVTYKVKLFRAAPEFTETPKPTISGTAKVGKKLTAKPGTWKPSGASYTYQWYRNGKKIKGATTSTYTLKSADKGKKITVKVTGSKGWYKKVTTTSKSTAKVVSGSFSAPTPKISGTAKVGTKLAAKPGTWKPSGVSHAYQWYRDGKKITGATASAYTLKSADKGKKITVTVTGSKSGYKKTTKTSTATKQVR